MPPFGVELKQALGNGPMTVADLHSLFLRLELGESPSLISPQIATSFKNTRVVEMSNRVTELGKDCGKLVVELDLRSNMDAATIREILEANQVPGVFRVALAE